VLLAIAGLKQVKDVLAGNLEFDQKVLLINDTAYTAAEPRGSFFFFFLNFKK